MKKILSLLMMALLCVTAAWAETVTFGPDFSEENWYVLDCDFVVE